MLYGCNHTVMYTRIFYLLSIFFFLNLKICLAEEKNNITTKEHKDWAVRCVKNDKTKKCEVIQILKVNNSNLQFTIVYSNFLNTKKEKKNVINIITPLGVNVQTPATIRFEKGLTINIPFRKCEVVGCIISLTDNNQDKKIDNLFNEIISAMKKSNNFEILIDGFRDQPIIIKSSLAGFSAAVKDLNK